MVKNYKWVLNSKDSKQHKCSIEADFEEGTYVANIAGLIQKGKLKELDCYKAEYAVIWVDCINAIAKILNISKEELEKSNNNFAVIVCNKEFIEDCRKYGFMYDPNKY